MTLTSGSRFGAYSVSARIGEGGMGQVFRGRDTGLNRDVALKILPDAFALDSDRLARFIREAQALAALNHPNIAAIYGLEEHDGTRALVMEFVDGEDLARRLTRGPVPVDEALAIARQIADALEAAHDAGIVHRDLKPANIAVRTDGTVKVLDFGLAKVTTDNSGAVDIANSPTLTARATQMGMIVGTAAYMAPEQARGRAVDRRADIWAFGAVLFEMLTGRQAFVGDDVSTTLASVLKDEVSWQSLPATVPPSVRRLLERCLQKDPRQRLSAIGDARFELSDSTASASPTAQPLEARARGPRVGLLLVAGAALIVATALITRAVAPAPALPVTRLEITAPNGRALYPDARQIALSPDGRTLAFITGTAQLDQGNELWIRALDEFAPKLIPGANGAVHPFWSPDGHRIGFFADGKLKIVTLDGGSVATLCPANNSRGGAWGARDVIVFAPTSGGPLQQIAASGGPVTPATTLDTAHGESGHRFPLFLPDGRHFLFITLPADGNRFKIWAGDLDSPARTFITSAESAPTLASSGSLIFQQQGVIAVQPFDAAALKVTGPAVALSDVSGFSGMWFAGGAAATVAGDTLAYTRDPFAPTTLEWVDRDGRVLSTIDAPHGHYGYDVHLSPDGKKLAAVMMAGGLDGALYVIDLERRGATKLADAPHLNYYAVWSPDSKRVAYSNDGSGTEQVFVRDVGAVSPTAPLWVGPELFKKPTTWSPDGATVLVTAIRPGTGSDLFAINTNGTPDPRVFAGDAPTEASGKFSPDGQWVAYTSDESGPTDVYVRSFPSGAKKYRVTVDGGAQAFWKADGSALLVVGNDSRTLKLASVKMGSDLQIGTPAVVGHLPEGTIAVDASADLQRFVVNVPQADGARPSIAIVQGWPALIQKKNK